MSRGVGSASEYLVHVCLFDINVDRVLDTDQSSPSRIENTIVEYAGG